MISQSSKILNCLKSTSSSSSIMSGTYSSSSSTILSFSFISDIFFNLLLFLCQFSSSLRSQNLAITVSSIYFFSLDLILEFFMFGGNSMYINQLIRFKIDILYNLASIKTNKLNPMKKSAKFSNYNSNKKIKIQSENPTAQKMNDLWMGMVTNNKPQNNKKPTEGKKKEIQYPMSSKQKVDTSPSFSPERIPILNTMAESKIEHNSSILNQSNQSINNKSPVQLIHDILKGLNKQGLISNANPYYSHQNQLLLGELLTNKQKLNSYTKQLEEQMVNLEPHVVKNYELLVQLLEQVSLNDVEVKHDTSSERGIEIKFNRQVIERQQAEIEKLQKEIEEKDRNTKQIVDEYEGIIRNFNDTMEKLVSKKEESKKIKK